MSTISIDGSQGEGGGQIVRSSMALSVLSGSPLHIVNIRAGRKKPGLGYQHVASVQAAADVCGGTATITGAELGSGEITFEPGTPTAGNYEFRVGTAGSATLVFQTILPILLSALGPSTVAIEGGTHNDMAPPFDFLDRCFLPLVRKMGATVDLTLERHGFFPAGGGRIVARIEPPRHLAGFDLTERGSAQSTEVRAVLSKLPDEIGDRQIKTITRLLDQPIDRSTVEQVNSPGPGTVCMIELGFDRVNELVIGIGRRGLKAEQVAKTAVHEARAYLDHSAPVGEHLADQLLMPLAMSASQPADCPVQRGGSFRTGPISSHTATHVDILRRFLPVEITVAALDDGTNLIEVSPLS